LGLPKCNFDQPEIEFFGMKFSAAGMSPTADKVKALIKAPAPTSVAEVRSFLGMANYSANFIQHYSETTATAPNEEKCQVSVDEGMPVSFRDLETSNGKPSSYVIL
jgi:hypothetical protein